MPIDLSEVKTASGHVVLRAAFVGEVTVLDAQGYQRQVLPGGKYDACGHLVVGNITGVSNDVRRVLADQQTNPENPAPVAVVLESALARMAAGLVMRLANNANTDFFKSEAMALDWLEGKLSAYHAKRDARP